MYEYLVNYNGEVKEDVEYTVNMRVEKLHHRAES